MSANDADRDPWLQAALRHAPDADAAPPAALRNAILQAARRAAPRRPTLRERIAAAWGWLARPPVAAAFASLFLASAVVVMWREPPPEAADPIARDTAAAKPSASPQTPPAATSRDAGTSAPPVQPPALAEGTAPAAQAGHGAALPPGPSPARERRAPAPAAAPATEPPHQAVVAAAPPSPPAVRQESAAMAPPEPPSPVTAADASGTLAKRSAVRPLAGAAEATADSSAERLMQRRSPPAPAAGAEALLARLLADPAGWSWAASGGVALPLGAPQREALAALAAAAPPWVDADPPPAPTLTLLEQGQPRAALQFAGDTLLLQPAGAAAQRATLDAALAARLRTAFARSR